MHVNENTQALAKLNCNRRRWRALILHIGSLRGQRLESSAHATSAGVVLVIVCGFHALLAKAVLSCVATVSARLATARRNAHIFWPAVQEYAGAASEPGARRATSRHPLGCESAQCRSPRASVGCKQRQERPPPPHREPALLRLAYRPTVLAPARQYHARTPLLAGLAAAVTAWTGL